MNETAAAHGPLDASSIAPYPVAIVAPDADAPDTPSLPADHPQWQRDIVSISSRARAALAAIVPVVVRALTFWDHRLRSVALGARTLSIDPAGCYRLR